MAKIYFAFLTVLATAFSAQGPAAPEQLPVQAKPMEGILFRYRRKYFALSINSGT